MIEWAIGSSMHPLDHQKAYFSSTHKQKVAFDAASGSGSGAVAENNETTNVA
jgi:hypothetical protein